MKYLFIQVHIVSYIIVSLTSVVRFVAASCQNSPYTSCIDSEIAHLQKIELTRSDIINATLNAFTAPELCTRIPVNDRTPYNHKTLCPWDVVVDYDANRFPPALSVVKCRCRTCFDNYQCKPVLYSIPVLEKQCTNNVIQWVQKTQQVAVACTCTRPTIRHVEKRISRLFHMLI